MISFSKIFNCESNINSMHQALIDAGEGTDMINCLELVPINTNLKSKSSVCDHPVFPNCAQLLDNKTLCMRSAIARDNDILKNIILPVGDTNYIFVRQGVASVCRIIMFNLTRVDCRHEEIENTLETLVCIMIKYFPIEVLQQMKSDLGGFGFDHILALVDIAIKSK